MHMPGKSVEAVAYLRTSSATNVGADKDSERRQREAIQAFAKRTGFILIDEFSDPGVSGADPIAERPGFGKLLDRIEGNGVRVVIVEDASRFARELMTQELGILALMKRGVRVLTANGDDLTDESDPSRKMMRQIAGAFAEYEKARLVAKLRAARNRVRAERGRCEGRKPVPAETIAAARRLARRSPKTGRKRSLRAISAELAALGHLGPRGTPYFPGSVARMLA
jgi:DNA invertase Pin-like site-specific DNA recombinase